MNYFDILLAKKLAGGGGGDVTVEPLSVTDNGTYSEQGKAYSPVTVAVPLGTKSITANGTYDATDDSLKGYSSVSVDVPLPENAYLLKDISGTPCDIATFADGANLPMPSLKTTIVPIQDLHGYDAPWVGGSGKNKLQVTATSTTVNGVIFTVNSDGSVKAKGKANARVIFPVGSANFSSKTSIIYNGVTDGSISTYSINVEQGGVYKLDVFNGDSPSYAVTGAVSYVIVIREDYEIDTTFYPMIRLATVSDATFAPYSNICPISGHSSEVVTVADDVDNPTVEHTYTIPFPSEAGTVYGGTLDVVNGVLTATKANIASYGGETLPGAWISDRDVYAEGTTPTTGAQVVYDLTTPITYQLSPTAINTLLNTNNIFADTGDILDGEYWSKNPLTVTQAMLNTLQGAREIAEITPEEPEESDER